MRDKKEFIREFTETQYKTPEKLKARYQIYEFGTSKISWANWVFDKINFFNKYSVLELGCGPGELWKQNLERIPLKSQIILSDNSEAMVKEAKSSLSGINMFTDFKKIDAQAIPYPENEFDMVIANHMLYHCPDIDKVLREIVRVLKPHAPLYASTLSKTHLSEFKELFSDFDKIIEGFRAFSYRFNLENGEDILSKYFRKVKLYTFRNNLKVPKVEPIIQYLLSNTNDSIHSLLQSKISKLRLILKEKIEAHGSIKITGLSGMFEAKT